MAYNIAQIEHLFAQTNIDLLIGTSKENIQYFTGFSPVVKTLNPYYGQCYAMLHRHDLGTVHVVHSIGEVDQVLDAHVPIGYVQTYGTFYREYAGEIALSLDESKLQMLSRLECAKASPAEALEKLIRQLEQYGNISRVGYDEDGMSLKTLHYLQQKFPNISWVEAATEIRQSRRRKTVREVEMLTRSAQINESAIHDTVRLAKFGVSEIELAACFNQSLVQRGAFPALTMLKIGRAAVGGQRRQQAELRLQQGDLLWFDSDAIYQGFWSDIARVYVVGEVSQILQMRYRALQNGMLAAFDFIRPGLTGKQVFSHLMSVVHRSGFPEYRRHHVGHAIGLEPYEMPILSPLDDNVIEEDMVLSIETPYYEFGVGALHIEDPLLVSASGNRFLTTNPVPNLLSI